MNCGSGMKDTGSILPWVLSCYKGSLTIGHRFRELMLSGYQMATMSSAQSNGNPSISALYDLWFLKHGELCGVI